MLEDLKAKPVGSISSSKKNFEQVGSTKQSVCVVEALQQNVATSTLT